MKKLFAKFTAMSCFAFASCHSEPHDNTIDNSYIEGKYRMTSWIMPLGSDFNEDGVASDNLIEEHACLDDSELIIHADFTYTLKKFIPTVSENDICNAEIITSGTWRRVGFTMTTTATTGEQTDYTFKAGDKSLTKLKTGVNYPYLNASEELTYPVGNVVVVFVKES